MRLLLIFTIFLTMFSCKNKEENSEPQIDRDIPVIEDTRKIIINCDTVPVFYLDPVTGNIRIDDEVICDTTKI